MGTNQTWDSTFESNPADGDNVGAGNEEFQNLKTSISTRLGREHNFTLAGTQTKHGWHKMGSARVFYGTSAPANKCDASGVLDSDDTGCLWVDTDNDNLIKYWTGSAWADLTVGVAKFNTISEKTAATGVTVDGVLLKDGGIVCADAASLEVDIITEATTDAGVLVEGVALENGSLVATNVQASTAVLSDTISEKSSAAGVTVDGMLIKDGNLSSYRSTSAHITTKTSSGNFTLLVPCIVYLTATYTGGTTATTSVTCRVKSTTFTVISKQLTDSDTSLALGAMLLPGFYTFTLGDDTTGTLYFCQVWGSPDGSPGAANVVA